MLLERVVLGFGDGGGAFKNRPRVRGWQKKEACWLFIADLLRHHEEELLKGVRDCHIAPETIRVYAGGHGIPNVLSFLHLTYEILRNEYPTLTPLMAETALELPIGLFSEF